MEDKDKVIDLSKKKFVKDAETSSEMYQEEFRTLFSDTFQNYIYYKILMYFHVGLYIFNEDDIEFLGKVNESELMNLILSDCMQYMIFDNKLFRILDYKDNYTRANKYDTILNGYIVNHILNRIRDWYKEAKNNNK